MSEKEQIDCEDLSTQGMIDKGMILPIMKYFAYAHLPPTLRAVSERFGILAWEMHNTLPECAETSIVLRKLLEAKDAAVRASIV